MTKIIIDGNDGTGKSTVVEALKRKGYDVYDRGNPTRMTDDLSIMPKEGEMYIILDASLETCRQRIAKAGRDLNERYHTVEDMHYYRQRFLDVAQSIGSCCRVVSSEGSKAETLDKVLEAINIIQHITLSASLFRIRYTAYEYLRDNTVPSATHELLMHILRGDKKIIEKCRAKTIEEQHEAFGAAKGTHVHEGMGRRDTVLNEVQQSIYWPTLLAVGLHVPYDKIRFIDFLDAGINGRGLQGVADKLRQESGQREETLFLRHALVIAGQAVHIYNQLCPNKILSSDIPRHDLDSMLTKDYLREPVKKLWEE